MTNARFVGVFKENRKTERRCNFSDNHLSNYTKTIILLRLSEYCQIIPSTSSWGLLDNAHFAFGK